MRSGVVLIGAGGVGSAAGVALAMAGVSPLRVVDGDRVERSNLPRQIWFDEGAVGSPKALWAEAQLRRMRPDLEIVGVEQRLTDPEVLREWCRSSRLVVDGSDNFETRFAVNDAAVATRTPLVHGAVMGWRGQVLMILPGYSPCLRCIFVAPPAGDEGGCRTQGVMGPVAGEIGWLMAMAAVRWLHGGLVGLEGDGRGLVTVDGWRGIRRWVPWHRREGCAACGGLAGSGGATMEERDHGENLR